MIGHRCLYMNVILAVRLAINFFAFAQISLIWEFGRPPDPVLARFQIVSRASENFATVEQKRCQHRPKTVQKSAKKRTILLGKA